MLVCVIHLQCLSTLPYTQPSRSSTMAMPIEWVPSLTGMRFFLFDSLTRDDLPSTLEQQIAAVYASFCSKDGLLMITKVGVQQQKGMMDCGLFAIAFAYHSALSDNVSSLEFDQSMMRKHLLDCFQSEELKPFPMTTAKPKK